MLLLCSCTQDSPEDTVEEFLRALDRARFDESAADELMELIDTRSRRELESRADRAHSLGRQDARPADFIAASTFVPTFRVVDVRAEGTRVELTGENGERGTVRVVEEHGEFRVVLLPRSEPF